MTRKTAEGLGYPNPSYWDEKVNVYGTIVDGLADCTCYVNGATIEEGHLPMVYDTYNADTYHLHVKNGWSCIDYDPKKLEVDDVIQWVKHCHVAVYIGNGDIAGSFYTGEHGSAYIKVDGVKRFDTRKSFTSKQQLSDVMSTKYAYRFFHTCSIKTEGDWVKGDDKDGTPEHILKHPLWSVKENKSVDQIYVSDYDMNVRDRNNTFLKRAEKGFFNVLSASAWALNGTIYTWYEVEKGKYIASVPSRVTFMPKKEENGEIMELRNRIAELENKLKEIELICSR